MKPSCKNCFHLVACTKADPEGHIPGKDYDIGENCSEYVNDEDVIIESQTGQFEHLTNEVFELFTSFQKSGFNEKAAYELTKGYLEVAFERDAEWRRSLGRERLRRRTCKTKGEYQ